MDKRKLLGRMVEAGYTQKSLAKSIGISDNSMSYKLNGVRPFNADEAIAICDVLHITDDTEKAQIFLAASSQ